MGAGELRVEVLNASLPASVSYPETDGGRSKQLGVGGEKEAKLSLSFKASNCFPSFKRRKALA